MSNHRTSPRRLPSGTRTSSPSRVPRTRPEAEKPAPREIMQRGSPNGSPAHMNKCTSHQKIVNGAAPKDTENQTLSSAKLPRATRPRVDAGAGAALPTPLQARLQPAAELARNALYTTLLHSCATSSKDRRKAAAWPAPWSHASDDTKSSTAAVNAPTSTHTNLRLAVTLSRSFSRRFALSTARQSHPTRPSLVLASWSLSGTERRSPWCFSTRNFFNASSAARSQVKETFTDCCPERGSMTTILTPRATNQLLDSRLKYV